MAPTWALPLPCLHPTQACLSTGVTLPHLGGHWNLCSQWEGCGGWHSGRSPTVRAAMALQEPSHSQLQVPPRQDCPRVTRLCPSLAA